MSISLSDVRDFIKGVKNVFYYKEDEMDNTLKYSMVKAIVCLEIEENKLMVKIKEDEVKDDKN